ncbi:MAG TPA: PhnD/SsuA/transferrin family substrate-binding protein [Phycisphaerae bacterium]|nr:PhnD/SsuA/transferrin family substrate-binding protein [Phycisphaerae bacterium]
MRAIDRVIFFLAIGAIACTGCQHEPSSEHGEVVQIGTTRADLFGIPKEYRAMHPRLESLMGAPVVFRSQPSGEAIAEQMRQGEIEYGFFTAEEFATAGDVSQLRPVAMATNTVGKTARKAHIVIKAGSHLKGIEDCKHKRFGFGKYKAVLTDRAARVALEEAGVSIGELLPEVVTPPPLGMEGRLYLGNDVAKTMVADPTVNAGVIDEVRLAKMKETGGNFIAGPSKDQFTIVAETIEVPEMVVVAGPKANPQLTEKLRQYLLNDVRQDARICKDMDISGFAAPKMDLYDGVRSVIERTK